MHSTETMEKTVKNEHLSKWKLICTESKNCCKSVLFRPKFGLESHGLKYIWYPPPKKPTSLHVLLAFAPVVWLCQKKQKTSRKPKKIFQDSCKSKNPKNLEKTKKHQKIKKKQYSRTLAKVKMQKSKKPRENQKNQKKPKKTIFQKSGDRVNRQESWNIVFFCFFWVFWFSRGFLDFCFCKSPGILCFFCFLVFSRFFKLFFAFFKLFGARNLGQGLVPSEALKWIAFGMT